MHVQSRELGIERIYTDLKLLCVLFAGRGRETKQKKETMTGRKQMVSTVEAHEVEPLRLMN
jgi:hypothetical protein